MAVVNTSNNQVVARWNENGSLNGINSIVKINDNDLSGYALSTDSGLRFIHIICMRVKGKSTFRFCERPTTLNKVYFAPSTAAANYTKNVVVIVTKDGEIIQYCYITD